MTSSVRPLVDLVDAAAAAPSDAEMVASGVAQYGQLLATWGVMLHRPGLFATYLPFLREVAGPGAVDPVLKGASALLVGYLNGCRYTVSHRFAAANRVGLSVDIARLVVRGEWEHFDADWRAALTLTRELTVAPSTTAVTAAPQILASAEIEDARSRFSPEQLVELTMSIAVWNGLARFHRVMGFELDMDPAPEGIDPR